MADEQPTRRRVDKIDPEQFEAETQETGWDSAVRAANQNLNAVSEAMFEASYNLAVRSGLDRFVRVLTRSDTGTPKKALETLPSAPDTLARAFAAWLGGQDDAGNVATGNGTPTKPTVLVEFTVEGLFGGRFAVVFARTAGAPLRDALRAALDRGFAVENVAGVCLTWPPEIAATPGSEVAIFVLDAKAFTGTEGPAANYVDAWLTDASYGPLAHKKLVEPRPALPELTSLFIGRAAPIEAIGQAITAPTSSHAPVPVANPAESAADSGSAEEVPEMEGESAENVITPDAGRKQPWIVSIAGTGGAGKSYVLRRAHELYGPRCVWAQVDHENPEESEDGILRLMGDIGLRLKENGCPLPTFDKELARVRAAIRRNGSGPNKLVQTGRTAQGLMKVGGIASEIIGAAERISKSFGLAGAVTDVALGVYERLATQRQENIDAILSSRYIQDVNTALCNDLAAFLARQEKDYLLPRRPVLVFDSYELIGPLADQWLRTLFLPRAATFGAVVLIAGRYHLLRFNTRWADYQSAIAYLDLPPFSADEARTYLKALPGTPNAERADYLVQLTGGSPLFLGMAAALGSEEDMYKALAGRVLEEIEPEWRAATLDLSLADGFNLDTVLLVVGDAAKADKTFSRISRATFVEGHGGKWRYTPVVREILSRYRALESPARTAEVQRLLQRSS